MDDPETFRPLNEAIAGQSPELRELFHDRWAQWYSLALSDIRLIIEGSAVRFADAVVTLGDPDDRNYTARITVFTDDLVITVMAAVEAGNESHTTRAQSRGDLKALEVAASTGALGDNWGRAAWPGKVWATLDYGDGTPLRLPGSTRADRDQHARLAALLPSLRADLVASPR